MSDKIKYNLVIIFTVISGGVAAFFAYKWLTNVSSVVPSGLSTDQWIPKLSAGRSLAIYAVILLLIFLKKREALGYLILTLGLVEVWDGAVAFYVNKPSAAIAPIINTLFLFLCSWYLLHNKSEASTKK
jgi:hypothetical protein